MRDYGTGEWEGGDPNCDHVVALNLKRDTSGGVGPAGRDKGTRGEQPHSTSSVVHFRDVCGKCGARRQDQQLGLEPTPDAYVARMVEVFREVRRVLRSDGTLFLNLGDTYAAARTYQVRDNKHTDVGNTSASEIPPGLKAKDLVGIPWRVAFALQADGWYLRSDIIWCLSGGTRLYARTQKGDMPATLKDLARLDPETVKLWNGQRWTQVVAWHHAEARGEPLEVELASGERIGCTPGHVWPTRRGNVRADELLAGDIIETTRLPQPETPDAPRFLPDAEIGWLVGRYLADGSTSGGDTVQIACHVDEAAAVQARAGAVATALHGSAVTHMTGGKAATVNLNGPLSAALVKGYVYGGNAKTKGLTSRVWRRSDDFLRALLIGYLEGDGHYDEKNDRWRLGFCRNDRLAADLRTLAARLGLPLRLSIGTVTGFGKTWPTYRGQIRLDPERLRQREYGKVVAVRRSRGREFWDVEVEDEPHLFALASGVLTHNSKPNPMPESVTDRPTKAHEYLFLLSKSPRYFFDQEAVREDATYGRKGWVDPAGTLRRAGGDPERSRNGDATWKGCDPSAGRNVRSVWEIATQPYPEAHFATYPEELVRRCILAGTSERGCCPVCGKPWERRVVATGADNGRVREDVGDWIKHKGGNADGKRSLSGATYQRQREATDEWQINCECARGASGGRGNTLPGLGSLGSADVALTEPPEPMPCGLSEPGIPLSGGSAREDGRPNTSFQASTPGSLSPIPCTVLDPFLGSGTTAYVARQHGRRSIGIELNPDYCELAARRLQQQSLFAETA